MERYLSICNKMKESQQSKNIPFCIKLIHVLHTYNTHTHLFANFQKAFGRALTKPLAVATPIQQGAGQTDKTSEFCMQFDFKGAYIKFIIKTYKNDKP